MKFSAVELDGKKPKEDGWKTEFSVMTDTIADEKVKAKVLKSKKGDKVQFNIFELEEMSREAVKKHLLNFTDADVSEGTETGEMYEGEITTITRLFPAELNQELFDKTFGEGEVKDEKEMREKIRENIGNAQSGQADSLLFREFRKGIIDANRDHMPLPNDFLKRWVEVGHSKDAPRILGDFDNFTDDMRWSLIKNKLYEQYNFELKQEELRELAYHRVSSYFGGYGQADMLDPIIDRMMKDPEQMNQLASDLLSDKLFRKLKETVKLNEKAVKQEELEEKYNAVMEEERKLAEAARQSGADEEE